MVGDVLPVLRPKYSRDSCTATAGGAQEERRRRRRSGAPAPREPHRCERERYRRLRRYGCQQVEARHHVAFPVAGLQLTHAFLQDRRLELALGGTGFASTTPTVQQRRVQFFLLRDHPVPVPATNARSGRDAPWREIALETRCRSTGPGPGPIRIRICICIRARTRHGRGVRRGYRSRRTAAQREPSTQKSGRPARS